MQKQEATKREGGYLIGGETIASSSYAAIRFAPFTAATYRWRCQRVVAGCMQNWRLTRRNAKNRRRWINAGGAVSGCCCCCWENCAGLFEPVNWLVDSLEFLGGLLGTGGPRHHLGNCGCRDGTGR